MILICISSFQQVVKFWKYWTLYINLQEVFTKSCKWDISLKVLVWNILRRIFSLCLPSATKRSGGLSYCPEFKTSREKLVKIKMHWLANTTLHQYYHWTYPIKFPIYWQYVCIPVIRTGIFYFRNSDLWILWRRLYAFWLI